MDRRLGGDGWTRLATWRDHGAAGMVMQHARPDGNIDALLVVDLDRGELEVVRVEGRVSDILLAAVADGGEAAAELFD